MAFLMVCSLLPGVLANDGYVAYRSNTGTYTLNSPKVRYWNNTGNGSWGNEVELASAGSPVRQLVLKQSPVSSKMVLVTLSDDGNLDAYVCMNHCDNAGNWTLSADIGNVWSTAAAERRFDFSFESATGNLVLVYGVNSVNAAQDMAYKVLPENQTSFAGLTEQYIDDAGHATDIQYGWISMDSNPLSSSREMIVAGNDLTDSDINSWVWNGTAFGNYIEVSAGATATNDGEALAVRYAADGTKGMVVGADGTSGLVNFRYWNGAWTSGSFDIDSGDVLDASWLSLKADPSTDDLQLIVVDSGADLHSIYWDGASWTVNSNIDTAVDPSNNNPAVRAADFSWLPTGSTGQLVWDTDGTSTTISTRTCSPQCTAATQTSSAYAGTGEWLTLFRNPNSSDNVKLLGFRLNSALDVGALSFNGSHYVNYGDSTLTNTVTVTTFESYYFDFRRDIRQPSITFISPNSTGIVLSNSTVYFNITSNEYLSNARLQWNRTINYTMYAINDANWNYTLVSLAEGLYYYQVFSFDLAGNMNISAERNITIDFPPNISLISPMNNTLDSVSIPTSFFYNVSDFLDNVNNCSLIIDSVKTVNTTIVPVAEATTLNFTLNMTVGQHNWSINCTDSKGLEAASETRNITLEARPHIDSLVIDDFIAPGGEIMLSAGSTRKVSCIVVVSDPAGPANIRNASAKFYYFQNRSSDPDDNNVHYSNSSCILNETTSANKTFDCGFNVYYYANNGSWQCNVTVANNNNIYESYNASTIVDPLYALNLTDGITFTNAATDNPSDELSANITNIGNMPINITVTGYAKALGDGLGMNCSDDSNISLDRIRFSYAMAIPYADKSPLVSSLQTINMTVLKQTTASMSMNSTYWQLQPDAGPSGRICQGFIVFNAMPSQ